MKTILLSIFTVIIMNAQSYTFNLTVKSPQGISEMTQYFWKDFVIIKTAQDIKLYKKGSDNIFIVDTLKNELKVMKTSTMEAMVQQQLMAFGTLVIKKSKRKKTILNYETESYKVSNKDGMAMISGKLYLAKFPDLNTEFYTAFGKRFENLSPIQFDFDENYKALEYKLSIEMGPQLVDLHVKTTKISKEFDDKAFVENILKMELAKTVVTK